jgi:hypothetical protein
VTSWPLISFDTPPDLQVDYGTPPTLSCIVTVKCKGGSSSMRFDEMDEEDLRDYDDIENDIPVTGTDDDFGIPEEIRIVAPKIPDIKLLHDLPKEIVVKSNIPEEIRLVGSLPEEIIVKDTLPRSIEVVHNLPRSILLDATEIPRKLLVEPADNFPSVLKMEIVGMPQTLQVTGIPKTIEIIENIPRTIQLLMPDNPVVTMKWDGIPVELKPSPDLEKLLTNLIIPPR